MRRGPGTSSSTFLKHAWLPIFILGWSATAFALQTVRALMSDEIGKLYVTAAAARGSLGASCCGATRRGTRLAPSSTRWAST